MVLSCIFHVSSPSPPDPTPRLLDQVRQAIRLKHFSIRAEKSYLYYIHNFIVFHNKRHPLEMGATEIRAYLSHLVIDKNVAASTQNVDLELIVSLPIPVFENNALPGG